jgi:hypothetical protein
MHAFELRKGKDLCGLNLCCRMDARCALIFQLNYRQGQVDEKRGMKIA